MTSERSIVHATRLALGRDPRVVLWVNVVGAFEMAATPTTRSRIVRTGLCVGSADLIGIITLPNGTGRFAAFEAKSESGRLRPEQVQFLNLVRLKGGFGCVFRSPSDALEAVERCIAGESE